MTRGWGSLPLVRHFRTRTGHRISHAIAYRPFDTRSILYRPDMVDWGRFDFMPHMLRGDNLGFICVSRQPNETPHGYILATNALVVNGSIRSTA